MLVGSAAAAALSLLGLRTAGAAQTLYWDPSASGTGTWDNGLTTTWATGAAASAPNTTWLDGANAYFANGNVSSAAYTVTVTGSVLANSLTFAGSSAVNVSGGTVYMSGGTGLAVNAGAGAVTIGTTVNLGNAVNTLAPQVQSWTNASASPVVVSGSMALGVVNFAGGNFTLTGTGDNGDFGAIVSQGTLVLNKLSGSSGHAVGAGTGYVALNVSGGATAQLGAGGNGDQIYQNSGVVLNGTFDMNGQSEGFNGLAGGTSGLVTNTGTAASTLTLGQGAGSQSGAFTAPYEQFAGTIRDGAGTVAVVKTGISAEYLTGSNTYSGGTTVSGGRLAVGPTGLGSGPVTVASGATLILSSGGAFANAISLGGVGQSTNGGAYQITGGLPVAGALQVNGNATLSGPVSLTSTAAVAVASGATGTMSGVVSGTNATNGLSLYGGGTLVLSGSNTYTGTTTIANGMLSLGTTGSINSASMLTLGGGQLVVAGSQQQSFGTAGSTNNGSVVAGASAVTAGASATVNLGLLTRSVGGTVDFNGAGTITTSTPDAAGGGFILGWATVNGGADFATSFGQGPGSGGVPIVSYSNAGLGGYTRASDAGSNPSAYTGVLIDVNASAAPTDVITPEALRFNTGAATTLALATGTNVINAGAILVTPSVGARASTITGGTITGGRIGDLIVHQYNSDATAAGALTINSMIADAPDGNGTALATGLTKAGPGMLILGSSANTYTGPTTIGAGTLVVGTGVAGQDGNINLSSGITNNGALVFQNAGNVVYPRSLGGTGSVTMSGTGTLTLGASSTDVGPLVVNSGTVSLNTSQQYNNTFPFSSVTVNAGATLRLDQTNQFGYAYIGGNDAVYRGPLVVNGGTVLMASGDQRVGPVTMTGGSIASIGTGGALFFVANPDGRGVDPITTLASNTTASIGYSTVSFYSGVQFNVASGTTPSGIDLVVNGTVVDNGNSLPTVTKTGAGVLQFTGTNTFANPLQVLGGSIDLASSGALGNARVLTGGTGLIFDQSVTSNAFALGNLSGAGNLALANNASSPAAVALTVGNQGLLATYTGTLSGPGSFTKTGSGVQVLTGNNTYAGTTTISGGTLKLGTGGTTGSIGAGTINFNANNTILEISRTDSPTFANAVSLNSGNDFITVDSGDTATFSGVVSGSGQLWKEGTGTLVLSGSNTYTGASVLAGGTLSFSSAANLPSTNAHLYVKNGAANYSPTDYQGGEVFQYTGSGPTTTNVAIDIQGVPMSISVTNPTGNLTVSGGIGGSSGFSKIGPGTLTLSGPSTYAGVTNLNAGTLAVANTGTLATSATAVNATATLEVLAQSNASAGRLVRSVGVLTVNAGGAVTLDPSSTTTARTVLVAAGLTAAGRVDLSNNDLIVRNGSLTALNAAAATGFAGGTWNGSAGLVSATAAADAAHLTALGVIPNTADGSTALYTSFDGQATSATDVLARYTYYGDTNLDGVVNAADYTRLDAGAVMSLTGWLNGDFNYDGVVDGTDYALADNAFNQQAGTVAAPAALLASPAAALATGAASAVPEPASVAVMAVAGLALLGRRRGR